MKLKKLFKAASILRAQDLHLQLAIETLLNRLKVTNQMTITFDTEIFDENMLTQKAKQHVLKVVREQLHNIVKYANASEVYVSLGRTRQRVYLVMKHKGQGPNRAQKWTGVFVSDIVEGMEMRNGEAPRTRQGCSL